MIRLDCPQCQRSLEIDVGFAGGVCRCFNCGTLMTVPHEGEQAERLTRGSRPERPDRPDSPDGATSGASTDTDQAEVFVTSTGRTVRISHDQMSHLAVARKPRMGLRIGIIAAFIVIALGMGITITILGLNALKAQDQEQQQMQIDKEKELSRDLAPEVLSYDPNANPLLLTQPNILGMPLPAESQTLVLVIDNSSLMRDYINFIAADVEANLKTLPQAVSVQVVFADETGLHVMPDSPQPFGKWDQAAFKQLLDTINPVGTQNLPAGLEKAMAGKPNHIVLITPQAPVKPVLEKMATAISADPAPKCDVIQLGRSNDDLKDLAEQHHGTYLNLPAGQLANWYDQYQRQKQ